MTKYELIAIGIEIIILLGVWLNTTINLVRLKKPPKE